MDIEEMSRAFVREQHVDYLDEIPDRPVSGHPNDVTEAGLAQIETALAAASHAYAQPQTSGDRAVLAATAQDLRYWTVRRATARVVTAVADRRLIRFGHTVTINRDDGRKQMFRIVGEDEADPARGSGIFGQDDLTWRRIPATVQAGKPMTVKVIGIGLAGSPDVPALLVFCGQTCSVLR
jgi:hypothetical protein